MKKVNCITINTDASFHPDHGVGGYAFYIVCDLFKIQKGGYFKKDPATAEEAEIMCIGNAISTLMAQPELPECNYLIINNDCTWGHNRILKRQTGLAKRVYRLNGELIKKLGKPKFEFRYVKAHNGTPDARSYVNDWCDREAKRFMRRAVLRKKDLQNFYKKHGVKIGQRVSHEDYSDCLFTVIDIDTINEVVKTKGGKNGEWINHVSLIIKNPVI